MFPGPRGVSIGVWLMPDNERCGEVIAWPATRERPRPIGIAITAGDLCCDAQLANSFVKWLRQLFKFQGQGPFTVALIVSVPIHSPFDCDRL